VVGNKQITRERERERERKRERMKFSGQRNEIHFTVHYPPLWNTITICEKINLLTLKFLSE